MENHDLDSLIRVIRLEGGRVTSAKRAVLMVLLESSDHRTADDIGQRVRQLAPEVSQSTTYRILDVLVSIGLAQHTHLGRSAAVFHLVGRPHGHLVCTICDRSVDIGPNAFEELIAEARRTAGFVVDAHHLAVSGVCSECQLLVGHHDSSHGTMATDTTGSKSQRGAS